MINRRTGLVEAGNGTLEAARSLGWTHIAAVYVDDDPATAAGFSIADNRTAQLAEWDDEALEKLLREVDTKGDERLDAMLADLATEQGLPATERQCDPDEIPEPPDKAVTKPGDLWILGNHRLLCGDSSQAADVDRLLGGAKVHLVNTDPPYNVRVEPRSNNAIAAGLSSFQGTTHHQKLNVERHPEKAKPTSKKLRAKDRPLANDFVSDEEFARLLALWFGNIASVLLPGRAAYIWGGYGNCGNYPPALKSAGLYFSQAIIWDKEHPVLTRKDFMGQHEWCQPADTQVETPDGPVPIASLRDGERVIGYSRNHDAIIGLRKGLLVRHTSRPYQGQLIGVDAGGRTTWATPGHHWSIKLSPFASEWWCVYLMRRGMWWRVGKSKLLSTAGFGVKHRLKTEDGEEAWILSVYLSSLEAAVAEQIVLAEYGIPPTTWSESAAGRRTIADIRSLYDRLDLTRMEQNARRLLADHGRCLEFPFLRRGLTRPKVGRRTSVWARTCNLLAGVMMIPRPQKGQRVAWETVRALDRQPFTGSVYSMDVEGFHHYVADGLVTHNCFYSWEGRRRAPVLRPQQRHRPVAGQEGQPAQYVPLNGKTSRAGGPGDSVFVEAGRERARPVRRQRVHAHRRRADRPQGVPDGAGPVVQRRDRAEVRGVQREEGGEALDYRITKLSALWLYCRR